MEPNDMLHADPLDILFENRNKSYGAYTLRKYYTQRMYISMGVTLSLVTVSIFLYLHFQTLPMTARIITIPDTFIEPFDPASKVKPLLPHATPALTRPPASVEHITPVITADRLVLKPMATVEDLTGSAIGRTTTTGTADNGPQNTGNTGAGTAPLSVDSADAMPAVLDRAELMPEFPGGIEALKRYLLKNLRMPDNNLEPGEKIRVVARFVVGRDGKVSDIEITHPADGTYNKEVERVISKMPDWKPGMQNHRPVAVYFSLPVNFVNME